MTSHLPRVAPLVLLSFSFSFACGSSSVSGTTPIAPNVTLTNGSLVESGRSTMTIAEQTEPGIRNYVLTSSDGRQQVTTNMMSASGALLSSVSFPGLDRNYEVRYPEGTTIKELLTGWLAEKVLVNGTADLAGLEAYCAKRGINLVASRAQQKRLTEASDRARCARCIEDYRACQVTKSNARHLRSSGVSIERSCEQELKSCSYGGIVPYEHFDDPHGACGPAPM
jgi:hypothetical protein